MNLTEALHRIRTGPQGPTVGAFFDFDGTLVHGFSGVHFYRKVFRRGLRETGGIGRQLRGTRALAASLLAGIRGEKSDADIEQIVRLSFGAWRGHTEEELDRIGHQLFVKTISEHLYPEAWQLIRAHEAAGHTLAIASSASRFQVAAAAEELGVGHVLCTRMAVADGVLTGRIDGPLLWRDGKAAAVAGFAVAEHIDLHTSYAYSNGGEDVAFLSLAGVATAVNPDRALADVARSRNWPELRFAPRGPASAYRFARTVAGFGGLLGGAFAGVAVGLPSRDRRAMIDGLLTRASGWALRGAGIRVRVTGVANARTPRPAVFLFNHQSQLDVVVVPYVLRSAVTGVAKAELVHNPVFGPLMRFVGVTFIDRSDTARAVDALRPVVDTLESGISIAVAPEGHRSVTPRLLPFKKGAFHLAIQAGVPVIPVVIRNSGEILARDAMIVRPGTIEVAVLDPIDVSGWDPAALDADVERVRLLFADTLANWPTP